jgi:hypothetical protein
MTFHISYIDYILGIIIPTDFHSIIFQRARAKKYRPQIGVFQSFGESWGESGGISRSKVQHDQQPELPPSARDE